MTSLVIDKRYRTGKDFIAYSLVLLAKWLMFGQVNFTDWTHKWIWSWKNNIP